MPYENYTCISIHKREYEKIKALADALGMSVRGLIIECVEEYERKRGKDSTAHT